MAKTMSFDEAYERIHNTITPAYLNRMFSIDESKAQAKLSNTSKIEYKLKKLENKLTSIPKLGGALSYVPTMISMVNAYIHKQYHDVPVYSIAAMLIALLYVLSPVDIIPDVIPGVGLLDDAAVVGFCLKLVKDDLDDYKEWRDSSDDSKFIAEA